MDTESLKNEAIYISTFFFQKDADDITIKRYINANRRVFEKDIDTKKNQDLINKLIHRSVDIEAFEFAWRRIDTTNILTKKIQILFYLSEVRSEIFPFFQNKRKPRFVISIILLIAVIRTLIKLLKGKFLMRYYGAI